MLEGKTEHEVSLEQAAGQTVPGVHAGGDKEDLKWTIWGLQRRRAALRLCIGGWWVWRKRFELDSSKPTGDKQTLSAFTECFCIFVKSEELWLSAPLWTFAQDLLTPPHRPWLFFQCLLMETLNDWADMHRYIHVSLNYSMLVGTDWWWR